MALQPGKRAFFIRTHEPAVTGNIDGKDAGKPALDTVFGQCCAVRLVDGQQQL